MSSSSPELQTPSLLTRALSLVRGIVVLMTLENPLIWNYLHGDHPQADVEGPYYLLGAPWRSRNLATDEELKQGEPLLLKFKVINRSTHAPIPSAILDIWQDNHAQHYAFNSYNLRGRFRCNERGECEVLTIRPSAYGIMNSDAASTIERYTGGYVSWVAQKVFGYPIGSQRPAHVHLKVGKEGYRGLTTQLYDVREGQTQMVESDFMRWVRRHREGFNLKLTRGKDGQWVSQLLVIELDPKHGLGAAAVKIE
ncbi:hypothetical protein HK104_006991 [Borealophlyctis nickersoniae]|nr:hypothetical protein HK104_006991 [Borealophlyctis nickersoniae]